MLVRLPDPLSGGQPSCPTVELSACGQPCCPTVWRSALLSRCLAVSLAVPLSSGQPS
jgi:hypothetical protein